MTIWTFAIIKTDVTFALATHALVADGTIGALTALADAAATTHIGVATIQTGAAIAAATIQTGVLKTQIAPTHGFHMASKEIENVGVNAVAVLIPFSSSFFHFANR